MGKSRAARWARISASTFMPEYDVRGAYGALLGHRQPGREAVHTDAAQEHEAPHACGRARPDRGLDRVDVRRVVGGRVDAMAKAHGRRMNERIDTGQRGGIGEDLLEHAGPRRRPRLDGPHEGKHATAAGIEAANEVRPEETRRPADRHGGRGPVGRPSSPSRPLYRKTAAGPLRDRSTFVVEIGAWRCCRPVRARARDRAASRRSSWPSASRSWARSSRSPCPRLPARCTRPASSSPSTGCSASAPPPSPTGGRIPWRRPSRRARR